MGSPRQGPVPVRAWAKVIKRNHQAAGTSASLYSITGPAIHEDPRTHWRLVQPTIFGNFKRHGVDIRIDDVEVLDGPTCRFLGNATPLPLSGGNDHYDMPLPLSGDNHLHFFRRTAQHAWDSWWWQPRTGEADHTHLLWLSESIDYAVWFWSAWAQAWICLEDFDILQRCPNNHWWPWCSACQRFLWPSAEDHRNSHRHLKTLRKLGAGPWVPERANVLKSTITRENDHDASASRL